MKTSLTHEYNKPDLSDWTLDAIDKAVEGFEDLIKRAASEALDLAIKDDETVVDWPAIWGEYGDGIDKKGVIDPLLVYFTIALGSDPDNLPTYSFNLRTILKDRLEECRKEGSWSNGLAAIRDALRSLADDIDAALPKQ